MGKKRRGAGSLGGANGITPSWMQLHFALFTELHKEFPWTEVIFLSAFMAKERAPSTGSALLFFFQGMYKIGWFSLDTVFFLNDGA